MVNGENIGLRGGPGRALKIEGSRLFVIFVLLFIVTTCGFGSSRISSSSSFVSITSSSLNVDDGEELPRPNHFKR